MKKIFLLPLIFILLLISCNESEQVFIPHDSVAKYPTKLNIEWEYNTKTTIEYYDTSGNIVDTGTFDLGNTIVKITKTNDTLNGYQNLIKFESYDIQTADIKNYNWYSNSDSGLSVIAYSGSGPVQFVFPKIYQNTYITFNELLAILNSSDRNIISLLPDVPADSIFFYEIPRKVFEYPLTINKRWVELYFPFFRERYVDKIINVNFNGQTISCYEVKVDWPGFEIEINDFVSLTHGLVRREIFSDSIMVTDPVNPDSNLFGRVFTYSDLVRINQ